jgi:hypothetical protein
MTCDNCNLPYDGHSHLVQMSAKGDKGLFKCCSETCATEFTTWLRKEGYHVDKPLELARAA